MDISKLYTAEKHDRGSEMQICDENGKKIDAFITIAGLDSKLFRKAKSEMMRELIDDNEKDSDLLRVNALTEITMSWRGLKDGEDDFIFTHENVAALYINAPFIMEQVDIFVNKRGNFTKS